MRRFGTLTLIGIGWACAPGGETTPAVLEADSAGIRIVTNQSLDVPSWPLDSEPVLQLGAVDDDGPQQFFRISAARRLRTGEIAVLDGSRELRVFDAEGSLARTLGREGDGPGEYRGPGRMFLLPWDTIAIWDTRLRRLTVLDYGGSVARTVAPEGVGMRPSILTVLPDGSTLFEQEILLGYTPSEYTQQLSNYLVFGPTGELIDSLPVQPRVEVALWGEGPMAGPRVFDEGTQFAGDWNGYWVGTTRSEEIGRYSMSGRLHMLVRWPREDRTVGADDSELHLREQIQSLGTGADPERLAELHRSREVADLYPAHGPLLVDALDHLWVQTFERPGRQDPTEWRVFDTEGRLIAKVSMPRGHRIFDIGEDYVLARRMDDLGIEYVRMFRLGRG